MVLPDIPSANPQSADVNKNFILASVPDRFLAFVIDAFLLVPVIGLFSAGQLREIKEYSLQRDDSPESFIVTILFVLTILFVSIFLQSVFTFFWQATPGQKILNLKVVSLHYDSKHRSVGALTFPQALLRSFLWWASVALAGLPFFETFSHNHRRCLHDRASDTLLVSLVQNGEAGPSRAEKQFVSNWMRMAFMGTVLFLGLYFMKVHQLVKSGFFTREELGDKGLLCEADISSKTGFSQRLDLLLSMQILEKGDEDCLDMESDLALWNKDSQDKAIGYLVKVYLTTDKDRKKEYQRYICETYPEGEECRAATYMINKEEMPADEFKSKGLHLASSKVLLLKEVLAEKNFVSAAALMNDLLEIDSLQPYLQKTYVKMVWQIKDEQLASSKRSPASNELQEVISDFKKRFEIP
jgi:uncharacterized RDD family membrane protein YckC